jgi:glycosyltransferase involved in cell wall biosynthesis
MNIWLVKIGEPIPLSTDYSERLHRTGYLSLVLSKAGHKVTWWTSTFDRVSRKNVFDVDTTVHPFEGVSIKMIHSPGYRKSMSVNRVRDYKIVANKFRRYICNEIPPDIILCAYPTVELSTASVEYGHERKIPVVLDLRDMWPDIIIDTLPKITRPFFRFFLNGMFKNARFACAEATALIGITNAFVEWGLKKGGREKTGLDRNFPLGYVSRPPKEDRLHEAERFWNGMGVKEGSDDFTVCFLGTFGKQFDLATSIAAARKLQEAGNRIRLVLCGDGDHLIYFKQAASDCKNILFPGWIDEAKMYVLLRRSSVGLNPIIDRYDFLSTINNKAIEYMSAGLPIISCPSKGVLSDLIHTERCGETFDYGNPDQLIRILMNLSSNPGIRADMSRNAERLFRSYFDADLVYTELMRHLENIVSRYKESHLLFRG